MQGKSDALTVRLARRRMVIEGRGHIAVVPLSVFASGRLVVGRGSETEDGSTFEWANGDSRTPLGTGDEGDAAALAKAIGLVFQPRSPIGAWRGAAMGAAGMAVAGILVVAVAAGAIGRVSTAAADPFMSAGAEQSERGWSIPPGPPGTPPSDIAQSLRASDTARRDAVEATAAAATRLVPGPAGIPVASPPSQPPVGTPLQAPHLTGPSGFTTLD